MLVLLIRVHVAMQLPLAVVAEAFRPYVGSIPKLTTPTASLSMR